MAVALRPRKGLSGHGSARGLRVPSYAKINLGLEVLGVRQDGYHELRTVFQTIRLKDDVWLKRRRREGIDVACDHPGVPRDGRNLAVKAAKELFRRAGVRGGLEIAIRKRIPVAGGMGGGSSNAAAVLMGLDSLLGLELGVTGLGPIARKLGADVPYFLVGGTALGIARGEEVYPLFRQVDAHVVVVDPGRAVSTAAVFGRVDAGLTPRENSTTIFRFVSRDLEGAASFSVLSNDLEEAALEEAPDLAEKVGRIRRVLVREGALLASLSGSGSTYFGLFQEPTRAERACEALVASGARAWVTRTLSLTQYRRAWSRSLSEGLARVRTR